MVERKHYPVRGRLRLGTKARDDSYVKVGISIGWTECTVRQAL